jgi:hypothetical protein
VSSPDTIMFLFFIFFKGNEIISRLGRVRDGEKKKEEREDDRFGERERERERESFLEE